MFDGGGCSFAYTCKYTYAYADVLIIMSAYPYAYSHIYPKMLVPWVSLVNLRISRPFGKTYINKQKKNV